MTGGIPGSILSHIRFRVFRVFGGVNLIRCSQWLLESHGFKISRENTVVGRLGRVPQQFVP